MSLSGDSALSVFDAEQAGAVIASIRPLGITFGEARQFARTHPLNPVKALLEPSSSCRSCAFLSSYPLAVLQKALWRYEPTLDAELPWEYGTVCKVVAAYPHAFVQHPGHPPGRLKLCEAAAAGLLRVLHGRPTVGLVACSATKLDHSAPAADLYQGQLFRKSRAFVERWCHAWSILSAEHWVVAPDEVIKPYDKRMPGDQDGRWRWDQAVSWQVYRLWQDADIILLGGQDYSRWVTTGNWSRGLSIQMPLQGMGIGEQMGWLGKAGGGHRANRTDYRR